MKELIISLLAALALTFAAEIRIPYSFPRPCVDPVNNSSVPPTKGELECLETIVDEGLVNDLKNDRRFDKACIPVLRALAKNDTALAAKVLKERVTLVNITLLHAAAMKGRLGSMDCLIKEGLDVNATDGLLWTPLHFAVGFDHLEATKALVKANSCLTCKDLLGYTPLQFARGFRYEIEKYLETVQGAQ